MPPRRKVKANPALCPVRRRQGVGGSDLGVLLGMSSWKKPLDLYRFKTEGTMPRDNNKAAKRGWVLEESIKDALEGQFGWMIEPGVVFEKHPHFPRPPIQANTDGVVVSGDERAVLEIKTVAERSHNARCVEARRLPASCAVQVQTYLAVTGLPAALVVFLKGPRNRTRWVVSRENLIVARVEPLPEAIALLEIAAMEFWTCVENRTPPSWKKHRLAAEIERLLDREFNKVSL